MLTTSKDVAASNNSSIQFVFSRQSEHCLISTLWRESKNWDQAHLLYVISHPVSIRVTDKTKHSRETTSNITFTGATAASWHSLAVSFKLLLLNSSKHPPQINNFNIKTLNFYLSEWAISLWCEVSWEGAALSAFDFCRLAASCKQLRLIDKKITTLDPNNDTSAKWVLL